MTNRQWLETLTNEELLKIIYIRCSMTSNDRICSVKFTCEECHLNWLNAEHKEDELEK